MNGLVKKLAIGVLAFSLGSVGCGNDAQERFVGQRPPQTTSGGGGGGGSTAPQLPTNNTRPPTPTLQQPNPPHIPIPPPQNPNSVLTAVEHSVEDALEGILQELDPNLALTNPQYVFPDVNIVYGNHQGSFDKYKFGARDVKRFLRDELVNRYGARSHATIEDLEVSRVRQLDGIVNGRPQHYILIGLESSNERVKEVRWKALPHNTDDLELGDLRTDEAVIEGFSCTDPVGNPYFAIALTGKEYAHFGLPVHIATINRAEKNVGDMATLALTLYDQVAPGLGGSLNHVNLDNNSTLVYEISLGNTWSIGTMQRR